MPLPGALGRKYTSASRDWVWQWAFPQVNRWRNRESGEQGRHHLAPFVIQRAVRTAVRSPGITKPASCHTFRHCSATHLLERGFDIRIIQTLLGHSEVKTTMIYTNMLNRGPAGVTSPSDLL